MSKHSKLNSLKPSSKNMGMRKEFFIAVSSFIFAFFTVLFILAFVARWQVTVGMWELPNEFIPFAAITSFVLTFAGLRMMR